MHIQMKFFFVEQIRAIQLLFAFDTTDIWFSLDTQITLNVCRWEGVLDMWIPIVTYFVDADKFERHQPRNEDEDDRWLLPKWTIQRSKSAAESRTNTSRLRSQEPWWPTEMKLATKRKLEEPSCSVGHDEFGCCFLPPSGQAWYNPIPREATKNIARIR